ncbi:hypothetical protein [Reyranella sp.]|uniref:hypothetical protein n=1 Tax=Reyranella sp. TaxID=1929291 RepID=UPI0011FF6BA3|nr:hypothetical protein [Reyranella sp.]TAJ84620.1 MAG: hypothetical protein EPO50_18215 [Reyranella sp.]
MTLRPEYTLGHSPYNAFLFATVGEEKEGVPLSVFSALTRLGYDPWREAARLASLPQETAARAFAVTIAMLPEGDWNAADVETMAARLVGWLPVSGATPAIPVLRKNDKKQTKGTAMNGGSGLGMLLACGILVVAVFLFVKDVTTDNNLEAGRNATMQMQGVSLQYQGPVRS